MKVCIFGLGRIGLPISLVFADSGYNVVGIDINEDLINNLKKGKVPFSEPGVEELLEKHLNKNFFPKLGEEVISDLKEANYIMIAVGTEFAKYPKMPRLSTLFSIIGNLIGIGLKNKTIILRVTLPIGTTDDIKKIIERKTGFKEGEDFWLSFIPERIMEGKAVEEERKLPKIVGCYNDDGFFKVKEFFERIGGEIVRVKNPRTAEFIKLIDNAWRNTRFAFANELAYLAEMHGIDAIEAINSANQKYERNQIPVPGPVSGYCLGKDPYLLEFAFEKIAKERGFNSVWYYGRRANDWLCEKIIEEVEGKRVLIAGLSFKENIDDFRYSHGIEIARILIDKGYLVSVCDPFLDKNYYTRLPKDLEEKVKKFDSLESAIGDVDTIIFTTRHREYLNLDLKNLVKSRKSPIKVIDLWNMFRKLDDEFIIYKGFGVERNEQKD